MSEKVPCCCGWQDIRTWRYCQLHAPEKTDALTEARATIERLEREKAHERECTDVQMRKAADARIEAKRLRAALERIDLMRTAQHLDWPPERFAYEMRSVAKEALATTPNMELCGQHKTPPEPCSCEDGRANARMNPDGSWSWTEGPCPDCERLRPVVEAVGAFCQWKWPLALEGYYERQLVDAARAAGLGEEGRCAVMETCVKGSDSIGVEVEEPCNHPLPCPEHGGGE